MRKVKSYYQGKEFGVLEEVTNEDLILLQTLPEEFWADVNEVGMDAFAGLENLTSIAIPSSVEIIHSRAFEGCKNLTKIVIPENVELVSAVFKDCENLTEIVVPEGNERLYQDTFFNCINLRKVTLPTSLKIIDVGAFENCKSLKRIDIPQGVTTIDESAFKDCTSLEEVSLPESVSTISRFAFYDCENLTKINLDKISQIYSAAFADCTKLNNINLQNIRSIGSAAFRCCESLTSLEFPNTLSRIEEFAFGGCTNLHDVTFNVTNKFKPEYLNKTNISINSAKDIFDLNNLKCKIYTSGKEILTNDRLRQMPSIFPIIEERAFPSQINVNITTDKQLSQNSNSNDLEESFEK